ncbi:MAG: hypothetical protein ACLFTT_17015 [Candidatus Hydrogenedentota bacterium]
MRCFPIDRLCRTVLGAMLSLAWLVAPPAAASEPQLLADINPKTTGEGVGPYFRAQPRVAGNKTYFLATTWANDLELWMHTGGVAKRLHAVVHIGKTGDFTPALATYGEVINYGTAQTPAPYKAFPDTPDLCYVNDRWAVACHERLFFVSHARGTAQDTTELFVSDGTPSGTRLVKDIRPGKKGAGILDLTAAANRVFFFADDGVHGKEPWVSDGTKAGTRLLRDVYPGAETSRAACGMYPFDHDNQVVAWNDAFYFVARDGKSGFGLWHSDGTPEGTHLVAAPYGPEEKRRFTELSATTSGLFWVTSDACGRLLPGDDVPRELWYSDGARDGARVVKRFEAFGTHASNPALHTGGLTSCGDAAYLMADDGASGMRLWRADGTGVQPLAPHSKITADTLAILGTAGGTLYAGVLTRPHADLPDLGPLLNRGVSAIYAHTPGGEELRLCYTAPEAPVLLPRYAPPFVAHDGRTSFVDARNGKLYARTNREDFRRTPLAVPAADDPGARPPVQLATAHDRHGYFNAFHRDGRYTLSRSAPSGGGIETVCGCVSEAGAGTQVRFLASAGGTLFFVTEWMSGIRALWRHAPGMDGPERLLSLPPQDDHAHDRQFPHLAYTSRQAYLFAGEKAIRVPLGAAGTAVEAALPEAPLAGLPVGVDDGLLVFTRHSEERIALSRTTGGTLAHKPFTTIEGRAAIPGGVANGTAYFVSAPGDNLWRTDGTTAGTEPLDAVLQGRIAAVLPAAGDAVVVAQEARAWGVWHAPAKGQQVKRIGQASASYGASAPLPVAAMADGRVAFFQANAGGLLQVWNKGCGVTSLPTDALTGGRLLASGLTAWKGRVYWATGTFGFGEFAIWRSDGTKEGTHEVASLGGRLLHELPDFVPFDGCLYMHFAGSDACDNVYRELWRMNETEEMERVIRSDPLKGVLWEPGGTEIDVQLAATPVALYFVNYTRADGAEPWILDAAGSGAASAPTP